MCGTMSATSAQPESSEQFRTRGDQARGLDSEDAMSQSGHHTEVDSNGAEQATEDVWSSDLHLDWLFSLDEDVNIRLLRTRESSELTAESATSDVAIEHDSHRDSSSEPPLHQSADASPTSSLASTDLDIDEDSEDHEPEDEDRSEISVDETPALDTASVGVPHTDSSSGTSFLLQEERFKNHRIALAEEMRGLQDRRGQRLFSDEQIEAQLRTTVSSDQNSQNSRHSGSLGSFESCGIATFSRNQRGKLQFDHARVEVSALLDPEEPRVSGQSVDFEWVHLPFNSLDFVEVRAQCLVKPALMLAVGSYAKSSLESPLAWDIV